MGSNGLPSLPHMEIISLLRFFPVPPGEISKTLLGSMDSSHGLSMYGDSLTALGVSVLKVSLRGIPSFPRSRSPGIRPYHAYMVQKGLWRAQAFSQSL